MARTAYQIGTEFELKIISDLERRGFVCIRAAGSKGAAKVDVIGVRPDGCHVWVQAKTTGNISPAEWNTLRMCAGWAGAAPLLARKGPRGLPVVYELLTGYKVPYSRVRPCTLYIFPNMDTIQWTTTDTEETG